MRARAKGTPKVGLPKNSNVCADPQQPNRRTAAVGADRKRQAQGSRAGRAGSVYVEKRQQPNFLRANINYLSNLVFIHLHAAKIHILWVLAGLILLESINNTIKL